MRTPATPRTPRLALLLPALLPAFLPAILSTALPRPVRADDSVAALAAGGLVLEKTDRIALVSEDLFLSEKAVRIAYRFHNLTDRDVETTIAFPMPDISGGPDAMLNIADPKHDNFLRFTTEVDGRPVDSQVEQRAFVTPAGKPEVEVTGRLRSLGIPLVPTVEATEAALAALSEDQRRRLVADGLLVAQEMGNGTTSLFPVWTLRSKFWRRQIFPAGRDVVVRQSYVPGLGGLSSLSFGTATEGADERAEYARKYCTDAAFLKAAQALARRVEAAGGRGIQAFEQYLSYVITSGGNWAGPIGTFKLTVDKGDPATLVSFCGTGVRKTGPTTFESVATDYVPRRDIDVLLLKTTAGR
ncbi:DUF4424 domain-containing protein [Methylobacterium radiotolerans]|uniref:DUF4424 domain-containing protein n=1 Tax=Methylobacterium TaxID=407 RepID=UPI0005E0C801|nr:DUF4424 domain-containing protein [Methylobacterium radiotolerans]MBN6822066.1 DUF4424 domain-containing protein [Methylobacterium organophilum]OXE42048.1 hypothetical protein CCS92_09995 [Methylobacterium radiotolerans]GAN51465.1 hypothetical protein ME121_5543 [Methylobacterium sp. ME121]